jgi:hypothetical protein
MQGMTKNAKASEPPSVTVRDSRTGRLVTVKGAGALKGSGFTIRQGIDLTKPIARQALKDRPRVLKVPSSG